MKYRHLIRSYLASVFILPTLCACLVLGGCAGVNWQAVGTSLITDVQDGTVAAADVYTAYQALNQNLTTNNVTTGKLTVAKVLLAAQAGSTAVNTPGLATAVTQLVTDAQTTISNLKGATPAAQIAAVSTQAAGTVSTVAALPPSAIATPTSTGAAVPTTYWHPEGFGDGKLAAE